jgi:hypothetical protein
MSKTTILIFNESSFHCQMYFVLHLDFVSVVLLGETCCIIVKERLFWSDRKTMIDLADTSSSKILV